jgi:hypothetical protein
MTASIQCSARPAVFSAEFRRRESRGGRPRPQPRARSRRPLVPPPLTRLREIDARGQQKQMTAADRHRGLSSSAGHTNVPRSSRLCKTQKPP